MASRRSPSREDSFYLIALAKGTMVRLSVEVGPLQDGVVLTDLCEDQTLTTQHARP
ncbi:MAG: hypothetical protein ACOC3I_06610 [Verrucomicrobiota bacterium]